MAKRTLDTLVCDRCGKEQPLDRAVDATGWGLVSHGVAMALADRKPPIIGSPNNPGDLCPGCVELLWGWWQEAKEPVEQPAAPPVKPHVRKPFTLVERGLARDAVVSGLILRVTERREGAFELRWRDGAMMFGIRVRFGDSWVWAGIAMERYVFDSAALARAAIRDNWPSFTPDWKRKNLKVEPLS